MYEQMRDICIKIVFDIHRFCDYLTEGCIGRTIKDEEQSPEVPQNLV